MSQNQSERESIVENKYKKSDKYNLCYNLIDKIGVESVLFLLCSKLFSSKQY